MKLNVGMYVRHNCFGIGKITNSYESSGKTWFNVKFRCYEEDEGNYGICEQSVGFKASYDIIDLIEVGDYVNGELVEDLTGEYLRVNSQSHNKFYFSRQIKTIVTKEQFESMSYKIGE